MGFLRTMDISASGMTAQRMRMDVITQNIANAKTTRTAEGGAYRRRVTAFAERQDGGTAFSSVYGQARSAYSGSGVKVASVVTDPSDFQYEYDPAHPDANEEGYVAYPNVDELVEMIDMMAATRAFEANVTAFNATKAMAQKALQIGK